MVAQASAARDRSLFAERRTWFAVLAIKNGVRPVSMTPLFEHQPRVVLTTGGFLSGLGSLASDAQHAQQAGTDQSQRGGLGNNV